MPKLRKSRHFIAITKTLLVLVGCGIQYGSSGPPNDSRPSGTLLAQGSFSGLNGKTVSGSVLIFSSTIGSYIARLEGISTPSENGLVIQFYSSSGLVTTQSLRSSSGSQNYTLTNAGTNITFTTVYIYSNVYGTSYGSAPLQYVNSSN